MKRSMKTLLAALLIVTPLITSCAEIKDPVDSTPSVQTDGSLIGGLLGGVLGLVDGLVYGSDANGDAASAWIGPEGGTIKTAAYTLTVPANAVSATTRFDVEPTNTGTYSLDLHAYRKSLLGLVDVGAKGFNKPVTLTMSYANARNVTDASALLIVYVKSDGTIQWQNCVLDAKTETVSSALSHFSKYAMVQN